MGKNQGKKLGSKIGVQNRGPKLGSQIKGTKGQPFYEGPNQGSQTLTIL
jgi:hypothetical protein